MQRIQVVDSHTAGEPTRVVIAGGPDLGPGALAQLRTRLQSQHDAYRRAIIGEPRGSEVLVGAMLCPPENSNSIAGVIYFNNVGYLGMCGHATIGLTVTLAHLGRIAAGSYALDTPVGQVAITYDGQRRVTFENVASFRKTANVSVTVEGYGTVVGDVAWGGNWFFLANQHAESLSTDNLPALTNFAKRIRAALERDGITGDHGAVVDHIELCGPPHDSANSGRNFVLCPGGVYDRSPCGTGVSAKVACLAADGKLQPGENWRQEGILGGVFEATYHLRDGQIVPQITGEAYITSEATLLVDPADPLGWGIDL